MHFSAAQLIASALALTSTVSAASTLAQDNKDSAISDIKAEINDNKGNFLGYWLAGTDDDEVHILENSPLGKGTVIFQSARTLPPGDMLTQAGFHFCPAFGKPENYSRAFKVTVPDKFDETKLDDAIKAHQYDPAMTLRYAIPDPEWLGYEGYEGMVVVVPQRAADSAGITTSCLSFGQAGDLASYPDANYEGLDMMVELE